jgi:hypothetical protein
MHAVTKKGSCMLIEGLVAIFSAMSD